MASAATSGSVISGLASCTAATIICSKQIAMIEVAFMKNENAGFCGFHSHGNVFGEVELRATDFEVGHGLSGDIMITHNAHLCVMCVF